MSNPLELILSSGQKFAATLFVGLIIVIVSLVLSLILKRVIAALQQRQHLTPIMVRRLQTFRRWAILTLTVLMLMQSFGLFENAWALISAGLATLAIGFVAAWSVLSNATAALLVLSFRPFRIGDQLELLDSNGSGVGGRVIDMNLMYTTLRVEAAESDADALPTEPQLLQVPNNLLFQKVLRTSSARQQNSTATFFSRPNS